MTQRWIELPDGGYLDANRVCTVSKVEPMAGPFGDDEVDDGDDALYTVSLRTELGGETNERLVGTRNEIVGLVKQILQRGNSAS